MLHQPWRDMNRNYILAVDSYKDGVLKGRLYSPSRDMETFESLSQFLIKMETLLDALHAPESFTKVRSFSAAGRSGEMSHDPSPVQKGALATFELQIIFRQHTSWQGVIRWLGENAEHSFRSVLELILLMDSALQREMEEGTAE